MFHHINIVCRDFEAPWTQEALNDTLKCMKSDELDSFLRHFSEKSMYFEVETFKGRHIFFFLFILNFKMYI